MSVDIFLKIDGVTGGSKNYTYKGWSDVLSWGWGMVSNRSSAEVTDKDMTSFREISISKLISTDSPDIMTLYAQGKTVDYADLNVVPITSKKGVKPKYLSLHMENVLVKSIVLGGDASEDFFKEKIILLFDRVKYEYTAPVAISSQGGDTKEVVDVEYSFAWDIQNNKGL